MIVDFTKLDETSRYKILSQAIIPRPIAWISTNSKNSLNIAPFSYFTPLSSEPPCVVVSIGQKDKNRPKDTLRNILDTKKATINFVELENLEKMHASSKSCEYDVSEAEYANIETISLIDGYPEMVAGGKVALFCSYMQTVEIEGSKTIPIILRVDSVYVDENIVDDELNFKLSNIGRVGKSYAKLGEELSLPPVNL